MLDHSDRQDSPDVSVVVPVYDEADSLTELAREIRSVCEGAGYRFEVWFVDDGSQDTSWQVIETLHKGDARIAGLRLRRNYGKSAALALGFKEARGNYVVTMDADLQDVPAEIPGLIARIEEGFDLVSGWKKTRRDPLSKRLPSKFFNRVTRIISGVRLHDFNCGLKAYRREVVKSVRVYGELHRYIPLLAKWEGYDRISEVVVEHRARRYGHSKFGLDRFIKGFLDLISVTFLNPVRHPPDALFRRIRYAGVFYRVCPFPVAFHRQDRVWESCRRPAAASARRADDGGGRADVHDGPAWGR